MMQTLGTGPERKYVGTRVRLRGTAPGTARCYTAKVRSGDMEHSAHHMCAPSQPLTTATHFHTMTTSALHDNHHNHFFMTILDLVVCITLYFTKCAMLPRVEQESHRLRYPRPGPRPGARSYVLRRAGLHQSERTSQSSSDFWILDFFFEEENISLGELSHVPRTFFHNFDGTRYQ